MSILFPRPHEDEPLSSVWLRFSRRVGVPIRALTKELLGIKWAPGFFQLGYLQASATLMQKSPAQLLQQHTLFPYLTAFYSQEALMSALESALATGPRARRCGPVTQSASDVVRYKRYCPRCAEQQLAQLGYSFWTRQANLPGVRLCLADGCSLMETQLPTTGSNGWSYLMPHEVTDAKCLGRVKSRAQWLLAERAVELLQRPFEMPQRRGGDWYRAALSAAGVVSDRHAVSAEALRGQFSRWLGQCAPRWDLSERDASYSWVALMVRPGCVEPTTTHKHLLFSVVLQLASEQGNVDLGYRPQGCTKRDLTPMDRTTAAKLTRLGQQSERRGRTLRIEDALKAAGAWQQFRHARERFPLTLQAIARLKSSPAGCRHARS